MIVVFCAARVLLAMRRRITLDEVALRYFSDFRQDEIPWADVEEVKATAPSNLLSPRLILRLKRPARFHSLLGVNPCVFDIGLHWRERERLVSEVLARAPHAIVSSATRVYLASPHQVKWRHRLPPLVASALAAGALGYAFLDGLCWEGGSLVGAVLGLVLCYVCALMGGHALDVEWRFKSHLVRATGLLALLLLAFVPQALMFGSRGPLTIVFAVGFAWAAVTTVLCLPIRPRGWQAAAGYVVAIAAALLPAWWLGLREQVPSRQTRDFVPAALHMVWSADGRWLYCSGSAAAEKPTVCHVVDPTTAAVRRLPTGIPALCALSFRAPDSRHVLYADARRKDGELVCELWAVEPTTGKKTLLHTAPDLSMPSQSLLSPDGHEMVFAAYTEKGAEHFVLRLADLTIRKLEVAADLSRFSGIHWQPDGGFLLKQHHYVRNGPTALSLWRLGSGEDEPRMVHRVADYQLTWGLSPNSRWGAEVNTPAQPEIVDLVSGEKLALGALPPGLSTAQSAWSPDGEVFAYVAAESGRHVLIVIRPASGVVSRPYATDCTIGSLELSRGGRYAACRIRRGWCEHLRIVDTATGRAIRPHVASTFLGSISLSWSPAGQVLAVERSRLRAEGEFASSIRLYELPP